MGDDTVSRIRQVREFHIYCPASLEKSFRRTGVRRFTIRNCLELVSDSLSSRRNRTKMITLTRGKKGRVARVWVASGFKTRTRLKFHSDIIIESVRRKAWIYS